ncbi:unnamed protein product [Cuscuta campestris]|uniref:Uncharacterized protein n=1 Tax=Cuscuta campestris TaxID=132261 RepID=A0A484KMT8_9ASTE|nr:unnamed protein product [Cuscuta campestris]
MFLAAVGRPRYGEGGDVLWDGKIGIFPFTFEQAAQRSSKNRPAGTLETKAEPTVNRDVMKRMLLTNLIPAIKQKWPGSSRDIIIQQDNAKPHVDGNDPEIVAAAQEGDWNIQLKFQPPNSPDLNVLDLGFFRSIDSVQDQTAPRSLTDLVKFVTTAFEELSHDKLNNVFLTLQGVMGEILSHNGGNQFKIPHMGKSAIKMLIDTSPSPPNLVSTVIEKNVESLDQESKVDSSVDSQVGDDEDSALGAMKEDEESKVMEKDDSASVADVVNVYALNPTSNEFFVPIKVSAGVVIAKFDVPDIIDNVVDADNKQAENPISFDIIKLCDIADVVKMLHLVSLSEPTCGIDSISQAPQFTPSSNMVENSRNGPLLWFSIISPVQKHEWEPPP